MYFYLGIVAEEDQKKGIFLPSYVQCKAEKRSEARSGWRVIKQNENNVQRNMPKVLVTSQQGNDDMIQFLCAYRTRDHMHGSKKYSYEKTKKYFPKGAQCWFQCNQYGELEGSVVFITKVPVRKETDAGLKKLKESQSFVPPIKTVLAREPTMEENPSTCIKPKLAQRG